MGITPSRSPLPPARWGRRRYKGGDSSFGRTMGPVSAACHVGRALFGVGPRTRHDGTMDPTQRGRGRWRSKLVRGTMCCQ